MPEAAEVILYSPDATTWQRLDTKQLAAGVTSVAVGTTFLHPGWYTGATSALPATALVPAGPGQSNWLLTVVVVLVAAGVVVVLGKWVWWRQGRRR